jgi:hypothetical protein
VLTIFGQWHIPRDHLSLMGGRGPGFFRTLRKQLQCPGRLFAELDSLTFHTFPFWQPPLVKIDLKQVLL